MGNFRIVIDAVGGHGQDRSKKDGEVVDFNIDSVDSPEAIAQRAVTELREKGTNVLSAKVYHWPADTVYQGEPVIPISNDGVPCITDDLFTGFRKGSF